MTRHLRLALLFMLFLQACGANASTPTSTPSLIPTATLTPSPTPPPLETPLPTITPSPLPAISRVLIVTFDGLRPDAIATAEMAQCDIPDAKWRIHPARADH
ncbi:MAG: hypothetical protein HND47_02655 [Chloroflexi bacterium]|nr:hypothetical protein [Chloroflexota bacterium]